MRLPSLSAFAAFSISALWTAPVAEAKRSTPTAFQMLTKERNSVRQCGEVIATVMPGPMPQNPLLYLSGQIPPANDLNFGINILPRALEIAFQNAPQFEFTDYFGIFLESAGRETPAYEAQYGVKVVKVCGSCQDYEVPKAYKNSYKEYCGKGVYGSDALFSGLALIPVEADTGEVVEGALKGAVFGRSIQGNGFNAPSLLWPSNEEGGVGAMLRDLGFNINFLPGMMAAGSGKYVAIFPDSMGFGESADYFQGELLQRMVATATLPIWFATKDLVSDMTNCATELVNSAIVSGFSAGGYSSIANAAALKSVGVDIILNQASAVPNLNTATTAFIGRFLEGDLGPLSRYSYFIALLASYSSGLIPGVGNSIPGQALIADDSPMKFSLLTWANANIRTRDIRVLVDNAIRTGELSPGDLNPKVISNIQNDQDICKNTTGIESLCEVQKDNEVIDRFLSPAEYPVELCHSPYDELAIFPDYPLHNPRVTLKPSLQQWNDFDFFQFPYTNRYTHSTSGAPCLLLQGFTIIDDETEVEMEGSCKNREKNKKGKKRKKNKKGKKRV